MSDITWTNTTVKLGDLKPWADNPRMSTKAQAKRILASFEKFGQVAPIAMGPNFEVYDGHQRLSALLTIHGPNFEISARQSSKILTDDERRALVLALANATGSWNWDMVSSWNVDTLKEWGFDKDTLKGWKSDVTALGEFIKSEQPPTQDADVDTDRAAELLEKWQVKTGDLWQIGEHRLICGDCTDAATVARVMQGEKADCVFTSPPYNQGGKGKRLAPFYGGEGDKKTKDEYREFLYSVLSAMAEICQENTSVLWNVMYNANSRDDYGRVVFSDRNPFLVQETIIWDKGHGFNVSTKGILSRNSELIFLMSLGDEYQTNQGQYETWFNTWKIGTQDSQTEGHGAAFPVALVETGINKFCSGSVVYEPFCGTGSSIVACENLSRRCRAIEISPAYVSVALERMSQAFPHLEIKRLDG